MHVGGFITTTTSTIQTSRIEDTRSTVTRFNVSKNAYQISFYLLPLFFPNILGTRTVAHFFFFIVGKPKKNLAYRDKHVSHTQPTVAVKSLVQIKWLQLQHLDRNDGPQHPRWRCFRHSSTIEKIRPPKCLTFILTWIDPFGTISLQ